MLRSASRTCIEPDVLSESLRGLQTAGRVAALTEGSAPWGLRLPPADAYFHVIARGTCWVQLEGAASAPQQLEQGDFVIFPHGHGHVISDAPGRAHRPAAEVYGGQPEGVVRIGGKGHVTEFICGDFTFEGARGHPLLEALPDMLHVKRPVPDGWREMVSRLLLHEVRNQQLGTDALISRLVELLFVQSVRSWLESAPEGAGGRLGALRDPVVRETIRRMHSDPVRACSVAALAAEARVSRSTLAGKFRAANDRVCRVRDWESNSVEAP